MSNLIRGGVEDVRQAARGFRWGRRSQVPRSAEPWVPETQSTVFRSDWARRKPAIAAREVVQKAGLEPVFRSQVRTKVRGLDVFDRLTGPVIFAANHASHLDTPLVLLSLPDAWRRKTAVAAAADYFFDTWWRAVGSSVLFNTFPIDRRGGAMATTPGEVLDEGWSLLIFPEGTRSQDGWMGTFRMGAAMLAHQHGVPVVPIAHRGTFAAMPRGRNWPAPGRRLLTVRFGAPIQPGPEESVRDFAQRVKDAIAALLDEDSSTWWEAKRRTATQHHARPGRPPGRRVAPAVGADRAAGRRARRPGVRLATRPRRRAEAAQPIRNCRGFAGPCSAAPRSMQNSLPSGSWSVTQPDAVLLAVVPHDGRAGTRRRPRPARRGSPGPGTGRGAAGSWPSCPPAPG